MDLLTPVMRTEPAGCVVAVGSAIVTVGSGVPVAVGKVCVEVSVAVIVGRFVRVGKALGAGKVGNGVNVPEPKLNKAVGVNPIPTLGKTIGVGTALEELRLPHWNRLSRME